MGPVSRAADAKDLTSANPRPTAPGSPVADSARHIGKPFNSDRSNGPADENPISRQKEQHWYFGRRLKLPRVSELRQLRNS